MPDNPTCETCKHWNTEEASHEDPQMVQRPCDNPATDDMRSGINTTSEEMMLTGPDFGCIHHEPKSKAKPDQDEDTRF